MNVTIMDCALQVLYNLNKHQEYANAILDLDRQIVLKEYVPLNVIKMASVIMMVNVNALKVGLDSSVMNLYVLTNVIVY